MIIRKRNPYQRELDQFETTSPKDGKLFSESVIAQAKARNIPVERDPEILRETGDLDLKKQVPPQVYAVVAGVMDLIRKLEEEEPYEGNTGNPRR